MSLPVLLGVLLTKRLLIVGAYGLPQGPPPPAGSPPVPAGPPLVATTSSALPAVVPGSGAASNASAGGAPKWGWADLSAAACPNYVSYAGVPHGPKSAGRFGLAYQRPAPECRSFRSKAVEDTVERMRGVIKDPDMMRLFENTFPNTLDTAIRWKGVLGATDEELTFMITGDINAMWLRDSANQMQSYLPLLAASASPDSIASLYRGVINIDARFLLHSPYCNSFQIPPLPGLPKSGGSDWGGDQVVPAPDPAWGWECKYELDSLAAFLQISSEYYTATKDLAFFGKYNWVAAVQKVLDTAEAMTASTYAADGNVNKSPYEFHRSGERIPNNPVANGTNLIRSVFRPSDDVTNYELFIPANMMFARYLEETAKIMAQIANQKPLADRMSARAKSLREAIAKHGVVKHPVHGEIYAYEVDGYGSSMIMDDANIPSLLSAPMLGFVSRSDPVYQNTRKMILSTGNPFWAWGPALSSVGSPHVGPGMGWPMASVVRILTSDDDKEIMFCLKELLATTGGLGLMHESVNSFDPSHWTRQW
jgi:meiotically up-regulated gene 157 (Mug157) protein